MKYAIAQLLVAVVPESETLVQSSQLRPPAHAVQSQEAAPVRTRNLARMCKKRLGDIPSLFMGVDGDLVNEHG